VFVEKGLELFNAWSALGLAKAMADFGALTFDLLLELVKGRDVAQHVFAKRRVTALRDVIKAPAAMRPTDGVSGRRLTCGIFALEATRVSP
jgi:hypothetical protein